MYTGQCYEEDTFTLYTASSQAMTCIHTTRCLKKCHFYFYDNFGKRGPIFIFFHC